MNGMIHMQRLRGDFIMGEIIHIFAEITALAFPVAFVFSFGGKIVHSFLSMGLDGVFKL